MKRKFMAALLAAALCMAGLGGCGSGGTQGGAAQEGTEEAQGAGDETKADGGVVTLRVWAEEGNFELLTKMIESFKQKYAGQAEFDIVLEEKADADTRNNLLGDVHNAADVFPVVDDQLSAMVAAGAIEPVADPDRIRDANLDEAVEAASIRGTIYGYPMTADNGYFLYYDKRYLTEEDVKTFDGILAAAQAAEKQVTMDWSSGWYLYAFFGNTGLEFNINDDGVTNSCNWNTTEGSVKGTDVARGMLDISASPAFLNCTDTDFLAGVQDGSVVAGVSGVWNAMEIRNAWGQDYGAVKLPTYTCAGQQIQMSSFTGYKMMGVNAYSENKEWALKLADWLTNEENQTLRFVEKNQGPSNKKAAASEEVKKVPAIQAVIAQSQFGRLQRVGNSYWDPCTEFGALMAAGNPDSLALQDIMDTLVAGITASVVK